MRKELDKLVSKVQDQEKRKASLRTPWTPIQRCYLAYNLCLPVFSVSLIMEQQFAKEMDNSYHLFTRYLAEKTKGKKL